jgi:uncharacterized membrane protein
MTKNIKQIIIVVVVIIVALVGFKVFFPGTSTDDTIIAEKASGEDFVEGQMIIALLDKLNNIKLDESIFSNGTFVSLKNFERELEVQKYSRNNPFLPIGVESSGLFVPVSTSSGPR